MKKLCMMLLVLLFGAFAQAAAAQTYPTRIIRLVAPSAPGGTSDIVGRILAQKLSEQMGQQMIVENRAGAGGTIGYEYVAKSPPDGYTLLMAPASIVMNQTMYKKLPYNSLRDFAPISLLAAAPNVLCVHPSLPARDVKELIALARSKPGILIAGSAGVGTSPHLSLELFKTLAKIDFVIVHYKGSGQGMISLLSGENGLQMPTLPTVMPHLKAKRTRPIGVTTAKRSQMLRDVPTIAEAGVPGYESSNWFSLVAPAGTPPAVIDRLSQEVLRALRNPEVGERITAEGAELIGSTPAEFAAYMRSEAEKWAKVVKDAGIKPE